MEIEGPSGSCGSLQRTKRKGTHGQLVPAKKKTKIVEDEETTPVSSDSGPEDITKWHDTDIQNIRREEFHKIPSLRKSGMGTIRKSLSTIMYTLKGANINVQYEFKHTDECMEKLEIIVRDATSSLAEVSGKCTKMLLEAMDNKADASIWSQLRKDSVDSITTITNAFSKIERAYRKLKLIPKLPPSIASIPKNFISLYLTNSREVDYFRMRGPSQGCINEEIPVTLVSKGFSTFQHELMNKPITPKSFSLCALKLMMAVSTMGYKNEGEMAVALRNLFVEAEDFQSFDITSLGGAHCGYITDLTFCAKDSRALCNIEIKLYIGSTTSDPNLENVCYHRDYLNVSKVFLVSLVGSEYFQVFGAVKFRMPGSREIKSIVAPICNPISLQFLSPHTDLHLGVLPNLAKLLYALQKGMKQLQQESSHLPESLLSLLPAVCCSCCNIGDKEITYEGRVSEQYLLFIGRSRSHCNVMVKFVQGAYGENEHRVLANHKLAPDLYGIVKVNSIWTAVIMERIKGHNLDELLISGQIENASNIVRALEKVMEVLNSNKIVHGDLLPHNILITTATEEDYGVRIVDFDWAGAAGSVKYPEGINMELQWPRGVEAGSVIKHEHDAELLGKLIVRLRS